MPWLLLLIAVGLFLVALSATSMAMVILCVLASLGLSVFAIMVSGFLVGALRVPHETRAGSVVR